jgi:RimJ/RimL family protein N-acetyltransferase
VGLDDAAAWQSGEDEEQRRWFELPGQAPFEDVVAAIDGWMSSWREGGPVFHWGIWVPADVLAGGVELRDRGDGRANVSYVVFPHARRGGVATQAVRTASQWAFEHLEVDAVVAVIDERNHASRGVAEKAGFVLEGPAEPWEYSETGPMVRYVLKEPSSRA